MQVVRQDTEIGQGMLSPSVALRSFNPKKGVVTALKARSRQRVRYGFRIDNLGFLIDKDTVSEIVEQAIVYPVPHAPPWLAGLINLRGNLVPVFDLKLCLGLKKTSEIKQYLLVLDKGDDAVCLLIDNLPLLVSEDRKIVHMPPLPPSLQGCVSKTYSHDKILWIEFDHRHFFQSLTSQMQENSML